MHVDTLLDYKDKKLNFLGNNLLFFEFFEIEHEYDKPTRILDESWWYEPSEFGIYFLKKVCLDKEDFPEEINKEDWKLFYPIFKQFFPTIEEYAIIKKNIEFLLGLSDGLREDKGLYRYLMMKEFGNLSYSELNSIPLKEALTLYYYIILTRILENIMMKRYKPPVDNSKDMTQ